jgi:hypothetical protein
MKSPINDEQHDSPLDKVIAQRDQLVGDYSRDTEVLRGQVKYAEQERDEYKKYKKFIEDAAAFLRTIEWSEKNQKMVLTTLIHDITGLNANDPCFLPRVDGYADREELP